MEQGHRPHREFELIRVAAAGLDLLPDRVDLGCGDLGSRPCERRDGAESPRFRGGDVDQLRASAERPYRGFVFARATDPRSIEFGEIPVKIDGPVGVHVELEDIELVLKLG